MIYFDTSVMLGAVRKDEDHHPACLAALGKGGCTSIHAMLEAFSILTGGRSGQRYSPSFAARLLGVSFEKQLQPSSLTWKECHAMLAEAQGRGIRGGAIYDYQHLVCARKSGAAVLLTLNTKDFLALARPGDPDIQAPA